MIDNSKNSYIIYKNSHLFQVKIIVLHLKLIMFNIRKQSSTLHPTQNTKYNQMNNESSVHVVILSGKPIK